MEINLKSASIVTTEDGKKAIKEAWDTLRLMGQVPDNAVIVSRALLAEAEEVVYLYLDLCELMEIEAPEAEALLPRIRAALKSE